MFDTLMYAKRLEAAGLTRDQAEAQINIIAEMVVDGVATKHDITLLTQEMALIKRDVSASKEDVIALKQDMVLLKQDVALLRLEMARDFAEIRKEFADFKADMAKEFAKVYMAIQHESNKNLKIMGAMSLASTTITIAVLGLLLK